MQQCCDTHFEAEWSAVSFSILEFNSRIEKSDSTPLIFESDSRRLHFLPRLSTEQIKKITGREKGNAGQNQDAAFSMVVKAAEAKELTMAKIVDDPPNCSRR